LLVIGRREERRALDDPTPHRNSRVALYRREATHSAKAAGDLPIRSHSTAMEPLPTAELATRSRGTVRYGFVSVPLGVFSLRQEPWRDGKTPAFLISDWGGHNGTIMLRETQVIRLQTRDND